VSSLYIELLVAAVVAFFILDEAITPASVLGGAVILLGMWLVNRENQWPRVVEETASR
jgi:drug/metabolite transporter (DMT)-like permease